MDSAWMGTSHRSEKSHSWTTVLNQFSWTSEWRCRSSERVPAWSSLSSQYQSESAGGRPLHRSSTEENRFFLLGVKTGLKNRDYCIVMQRFWLITSSLKSRACSSQPIRFCTKPKTWKWSRIQRSCWWASVCPSENMQVLFKAITVLYSVRIHIGKSIWKYLTINMDVLDMPVPNRWSVGLRNT